MSESKPAPYYDRDGITIYCGDAMQIIPHLKKIGAVIVDPPYSSGGNFRSDRQQATTTKYVQSGSQLYRPEFSGDSRDQRSFLSWCSMWLSRCKSVSCSGASVMCFSDWRQLPTLTDAIQIAGWSWRGLATWWKPGIRMQSGSFSHSAEYVVHGTNGPHKRKGSHAQNVFKCAPVGVKGKEHIAEKPLEVMHWLMSLIPDKAIVLDPFAGSGTTLIAAKQLGNPAIGIEIEERYCAMAVKRLKRV